MPEYAPMGAEMETTLAAKRQNTRCLDLLVQERATLRLWKSPTPEQIFHAGDFEEWALNDPLCSQSRAMF